MFLFYVLSVSLCLSSFSTCISVIFNPVGTFRTVANYLLYALGFSVLLNFLFVALAGVYFDTQASPEEQGIREIVDETLDIEVHHEAANSQDAIDLMPRQRTRHEASSSQEIVDATPIQEAEDREVSAPEEVKEATLTQEAHPEHAALLAHRAECERLSHTLRPPSIEAQAATLHTLHDIDTFTTNPITRDDRTPPPTLQQVESEDDSEKRCTDSANTKDEIPRSCDNLTASVEQMSNVGEQKKNTSSEAQVAYHTETASQEKATAKTITARESKKIEKWISQTEFANTHAATTAKAFRGMLNKGDDADDEDEDGDLNRETGEMMAYSGPLSETHSVDRDSDFQKALRVYMGMGGKCGGRRRRRRSCSTPSLASSGESEFQGWVRKTFMLEKGGERRRRARSA